MSSKLKQQLELMRLGKENRNKRTYPLVDDCIIIDMINNIKHATYLDESKPIINIVDNKELESKLRKILMK